MDAMKNVHRYPEYACLFVFGATDPHPQWARASSFTKFLDHTQRRTTVGRTPLDECSASRTENTHNRQTPMHPVGFETTISAGEQPQTYAPDRSLNMLENKRVLY
jgi:hypothetical protein